MLTFLTTTALLGFSPSPAHHRPRAARPRAPVSSPRMDEEPDDGGDRLVPAVLHTEMQDSYMSYAMSVIMSRALPDARGKLQRLFETFDRDGDEVLDFSEFCALLRSNHELVQLAQDMVGERLHAASMADIAATAAQIKWERQERRQSEPGRTQRAE